MAFNAMMKRDLPQSSREHREITTHYENRVERDFSVGTIFEISGMVDLNDIKYHPVIRQMSKESSDELLRKLLTNWVEGGRNKEMILKEFRDKVKDEFKSNSK